MKKMRLAITAILVAIAMQASFAQAQVGLGLKAGLNFTNVNTATIGSVYSSRTGFHAGAFLSVKLTKLAIQPEIIFSQQGSEVSVGGAKIESTLSYVNIPVMLKWYLIGGLNLQAGPQFGFLTSAIGPVTSGTSFASGDIKNTLKSSDISIGLGAGFDIKKLTIDARYNLGVSEVNDTAGSASAKNQVFQLSLGYKFLKFGK